jgi:hypothetical protein
MRGSAPPKQSEKLSVLARMVADRAAEPNIHRRRICIFLGAGADVSSGGPTFAELEHRAIERFSNRKSSADRARCRPAPVKISTLRAEASTSDTFLCSEIDMSRSSTPLRISSLVPSAERWAENIAYENRVSRRYLSNGFEVVAARIRANWGPSSLLCGRGAASVRRVRLDRLYRAPGSHFGEVEARRR